MQLKIARQWQRVDADFRPGDETAAATDVDRAAGSNQMGQT